MPGIPFNGLLESIFVLALVGAIVVYFKFAHSKRLSLHMLKQRYAKGEISRDEYLRCKTELLSGR